MTAEDNIGPPQVRPIVLSPWLVVAGGLLLYGLTLNHWVTLKSLPLVSQVTGWDWHPLPLPWRTETLAPLFLVLTAPVRLLPIAWQPVVLNIFAAVCAALTLGLLARSVRLLAHDRTPDQRLRLTGDIRDSGYNALLPIRAAFLPPLFAVLMLAGQQTFWQNAVAVTGEMLNLMLFAFVIYSLLRFRLSQGDKWLLVSAFVYGLGTTNDWAFIGFFPVYLVALIWSKGLIAFFNVRFLGRMLLCGLAGLLLYLMIPLLNAAGGGPTPFFSLLRQELGAQKFSLRLVPPWVVLLAAVPTILPLFLAAIRWPSFEGEISVAGNLLTRWMIQVSHIAFLLLALVTFFDFKYSPSMPMREQPVSFLTFYYLGALCLGYFSGYVLMVFGPRRLRAWERPNPIGRMINLTLVLLIWLLAFGAPGLLAWQNYPHIQAGNSGALARFATEALQGLPDKAIVLSDDPERLYLLQALCARNRAANRDILIDTGSFPHREYILDLVSRYPELKHVVTTNLARLPLVLSSDNLVRFMYLVTRNYPVYYLHPSFGYYFEALYFKPRGVVYELKPYTTNTTQPPMMTDEDFKANQSFWARMESGPLKSLPALAKLDSDAEATAIDYAVALDYWGTELQKAGHLKEARHQFAEAVEINSNNFIARINLEYNERLQKGDHRPIDSDEIFYKALALYHGFLPMLKYNGPVDEPGLDLLLGQALANGRNLGQAKLLFERRLQLLPDDPDGELAMAKTYVDLRQPAKALALVRKLHGSSKINAWELARCEALAYMSSQDYSTAERVLHDAVRADPTDENRVATLADYFRLRGLEASRQGNAREAALWFTNALTNLNLQLQLLASPSHNTAATMEVPETLLKKAEVEMKLRSYNAAVSTLGQVLELQPDDYTALLNRALAEAALKQYPAAKDDYKALRKLLPGHTYVVDIGLADLAAAEKNSAEEINCLERYVKSAPEDSADFKRASQRLGKLKSR
jgi:tetratricopeptide (TPR) repeat protein